MLSRFCFLKIANLDATALRRGDSRSQLSVTFRFAIDATALRRGDSRSQLSGTFCSLKMPRPCAVEIHVRSYQERFSQLKMPRPCAVEIHVRSYQERFALLKMPRPCAVKIHARSYQERFAPYRCHGLAPWRFTFAAIRSVSHR